MAKIYWFLGHEQFQPEVLVEHAILAEKSGFDGVMVSEHFHPWVDDEGAGGFAFATLAAIAQATNKLQLMTAVTTPLFRYHPAIVAQAAATIDRLSGGRFALGIGTGENINEGPLGLNFPAHPERLARLTEAIEIMEQLLGGKKLRYDGTYYQTEAAKLYSPPLHKVPIYVAAGGPKTATMAGQQADGLIVSVKDPAEARAQSLSPALEAAGRKPFKVIASRWSVYAKNNQEAWQALKPWRGLRAPDRLSTKDPAHLRSQADELGPEAVLERYSRATSAEDFVEIYRPLITEIGADIIGIQATSLDQPSLIKLLGEKVLPQLRKLKERKES